MARPSRAASRAAVPRTTPPRTAGPRAATPRTGAPRAAVRRAPARRRPVTCLALLLMLLALCAGTPQAATPFHGAPGTAGPPYAAAAGPDAGPSAEDGHPASRPAPVRAQRDTTGDRPAAPLHAAVTPRCPATTPPRAVRAAPPGPRPGPHPAGTERRRDRAPPAPAAS
ncbi:hypothetical protein [Streptomyces zingiberis]|uniref:Uncharacterized protein n=1 Tax=Streptomyces zingiberis TaxID=2053010 RepID=A0ABX1C4C4_9ACTN|nr:hypothetical protein [Streptomyces zingiberis]NJQ03463.1 hypothetical protein [Streptomyces zingiberis]